MTFPLIPGEIRTMPSLSFRESPISRSRGSFQGAMLLMTMEAEKLRT